MISDLARSTTTLIESIIILCVSTIPSTQADGVSTLIVCSIIVVGAFTALLTWMREVYLFLSAPRLDSLPKFKAADYARAGGLENPLLQEG